MWNKIVSQRVKKYGLIPIVGDLVFKDNDLKDVPVEVIDEVDEEEEEEEAEAVISGKKLPEVETISEDTLSKYTIFDIVYPLPGCDVRYPDNEIGQWYIDLLAEDNLTSEKLSKKNKYVFFFILYLFYKIIFLFNYIIYIYFSECFH